MNSNPGRTFVIGLVAMIIFKGIAAVVGTVINPHYIVNYIGGWVGIASGIVGKLIGLLFLFIFIWIMVWFARSIGWMSRSYRYSSCNRWTWWDHDDAMEILKDR